MSTATTLPPDPEGENNSRAYSADVAIRAFARYTLMTVANEEDRTILTDLLCDMMHWCDRCQVDFDGALSNAREHYAEETRAD